MLKRGANGSLDLYEWWNQVRDGDVNGRRNVTIQLLNEDRTAMVLVWRLKNAFPVRHTFSALNATGQETLLEILELTFEELQME